MLSKLVFISLFTASPDQCSLIMAPERPQLRIIGRDYIGDRGRMTKRFNAINKKLGWSEFLGICMNINEEKGHREVS